MGFWSTNLYGNDISCDIRQKIMDEFIAGTNIKSIIAATKKDYYNSADEGLYYLVLSDIMWDYGILTDSIKKKALSYIEKECYSDYWESVIQKKEWAKTLLKLKNKLESDYQGNKEIKPIYRMTHINWEKGDIYAYQLKKKDAFNNNLKNKYILFQVIGFNNSLGKKKPIIVFFKQIYNKIPLFDDIKEFDFLPLYPVNDELYGKDLNYCFNKYSIDVWGYYQHEYNAKKFIFITNTNVKYTNEAYYSDFNYLDFSSFEQFIIYYLKINNLI